MDVGEYGELEELQIALRGWEIVYRSGRKAGGPGSFAVTMDMLKS